MQASLSNLNQHTPKLAVVEPRGLGVRSVDYYRALENEDVEARVNRTEHDALGRESAWWDPRLFVTVAAPANLIHRHGLSGTLISTDSVDAGLRVNVVGEAGQQVQVLDGRGTQRRLLYDNQLRLTTLFEYPSEGTAVCAECLTYAADDQMAADHNQCGRLTEHKDLAGSLAFVEYAMSGLVLEQQRCYADQPQTLFTTHFHHNPVGDMLSHTDARGHERFFSHTADGKLSAVSVRLSQNTERLPIVSGITYDAHGQVTRETAGNGVLTDLEYAAADGRLIRLTSRLGQREPLQDLRYAYDAVGNIVCIEDAVLPVRHFANQLVEPVRRFRYDSLYRLIEATGWEAGGVRQGPDSAPNPDPAVAGNYRQNYRYDAGNNLLELTHIGPQNHSHRLIAARHSNRCLAVRENVEPTEQDLRDGFDANGNLLALQPGRLLRWDLRNQLSEVRPVERDGSDSDCEQYRYGADGMRVSKIRSLLANARSVVIRTLDLPGLHVRSHGGTGELLHIVDVSTGRGSVRILHWEAGKPHSIPNDQQRYDLTDHLGSGTMELDQDANIITLETYYPFGGTAWSSGDAVQVSYKTVRYSGKERDATGLYYYGFRYYISWWQRWLNADPAGSVDGINLYQMVRSNPVSLQDYDGQESNFKKLFKSEQGDMMFGLSKVLIGKLSWFSMISHPGELLAMYMSGPEVSSLEGQLRPLRIHLRKADDILSGGGMQVDKSIEERVWKNYIDPVNEKLFIVERKSYENIKLMKDSWSTNSAYKNFAKAYADELSESKYSIYETVYRYLDLSSEEFSMKLVNRISKGGLSTLLKSKNSAIVHFMLDEVDMERVVLKTLPSPTSSELRYLYRNRQQLADKVLFYKNNELVDAPWRTDRTLWQRYQPRSERNFTTRH